MKNRHWWIIALGMALVVAQVVQIRPALAQDFGANWQAFFWNNKTFTGNPVASRTDPAVNFNWQTGSPDPAVPADNFSARWSTTITFTAGTYRFRAGADDGVRVAIDGNLIINAWADATNGFRVSEVDISLGAGPHALVVDYYESSGNAGVQFSWIPAPAGPAPTAVPAVPNQTAPDTHAAPPSSALPVSAVKAVVIVDLANLRSGPSTTFPTIAELRRDERLGVVANNGANTWYLVQLSDGRRGWIFRYNIYLYNGDWTKIPVTTAEVQAAALPVRVEGEARVTMLVRSAPSLRFSEKIGTIGQGQSFKILRLSKNRGWVFVDADGLQGWVSLQNVKVVLGDLGRLPVGN